MSPSPRLLLTIDYESWFAVSRRYDKLPPDKRRKLDAGFTREAIDPILDRLKDAKASFFLVGELIDWYPELPQKIFNAGHEIGFHCQVHRPLTTVEDLQHDLRESTEWRKKFNVLGYRAPMIRTIEDIYPVLQENNFIYSSSLYASYRYFNLQEQPMGISCQYISVYKETEANTRSAQYEFVTLNARRISICIWNDERVISQNSLQNHRIGI